MGYYGIWKYLQPYSLATIVVFVLLLIRTKNELIEKKKKCNKGRLFRYIPSNRSINLN